MYAAEMQRLFTMFPGGAAGLALLLLRVGVAGSLWEALLDDGPEWSTSRLFSLSAVSGLLLCGCATPLASLAAVAIHVLRLIDPLKADMLLSAQTLTVAVHAISALSLLLIGPGAYSIDARLFGRRVLTSS